MKKCRLCPRQIQAIYQVCLRCKPTFDAWRNGKRELRAKAHSARLERLRGDLPWGGLFSKP